MVILLKATLLINSRAKSQTFIQDKLCYHQEWIPVAEEETVYLMKVLIMAMHQKVNYCTKAKDQKPD